MTARRYRRDFASSTCNKYGDKTKKYREIPERKSPPIDHFKLSALKGMKESYFLDNLLNDGQYLALMVPTQSHFSLSPPFKPESSHTIIEK